MRPSSGGKRAATAGTAAATLLLALCPVIAFGAGAGVPGLNQERIPGRLDALRVPFVANSGQTDPFVAYYAATPASTIFVTKDGHIVYSLPGKCDARRGARTVGSERFREHTGWSLTELLVGGQARPKGAEPSPTRVSYFIGNDPARWRGGLATFDKVSMGKVWPRILVELRAHAKGIEKVFTIQAGGDPSRIKIQIEGADSLRTDARGALVVRGASGGVTFSPPAAFQEHDGARRNVRVAYRVRGDGYGFSLGPHDSSLPVVIDPIVQSTYLGGSGIDSVVALAIHPISGEVYLAGTSESSDFPGTIRGAQSSNRGFTDVFVARLTADLKSLIQATYLGGAGDDHANALAIHPGSGDVYLSGTTNSVFPGTTGGAQESYGGSFVARLTADLTTLTRATYVGGHDDIAYAVAIHPSSGDVYLAGVTASASLLGTAGGAQAAYGGNGDAFVARLTGDLATLRQATYLGGSGNDEAFALAIQPGSGDVYVAGYTDSTNLPGTSGGAQPNKSNGLDAFVARLTADLTKLTNATYLGGSGFDFANVLAIHPTSKDVYVAGKTSSTDFPGTVGGAQSEHGTVVGPFDAFIARLAADLTTLANATYLGGSSDDEARAVAIHPASGDVYVAGQTRSTDFPGTATGAQATAGGPISSDAFVARLTANLTTLTRATYLGGGGNEQANALAIHPISGHVFVAGQTNDTDFPGTSGGAQEANGFVGGGLGSLDDAFCARLTADLAAPRVIRARPRQRQPMAVPPRRE